MLEYTLRTYQSPTRLVQRLGAIQELGNEAGQLGMRRPLLVTDAGVKAAGLLEVALESLRRSDVEPVVFDKVRANPGVQLVDEGAAEYRSQGCDGLVAIGGGSSMDTAKGIGVVAAHDGMPPGVTAGTGMDALAHAVECFTMSYHQPFTDAVALLAMEYVARYLRVAFSQANNLEARYHMSAAATLAGLAYGTDSAGAAHAMSQTAGGVHDAPHGALTARLLGPVMEYNHSGEPERFARMAAAFGLDTRGVSTWRAAEMAVEYVHQLTVDVDIPAMQELGFSQDEIPMLADKAFADPQTIGNPRDVDASAYRTIYQQAFELGSHRNGTRR